MWEGEKLTKERAFEVSGIKTVYWLSEFDKVFFGLMTEAETIYFNTNEHYRQSVETETREDRFIKKTKEQFPAHSWAKSNPILQRLRSVKDAIEIVQLLLDAGADPNMLLKLIYYKPLVILLKKVLEESSIL